MENEIRFVDGVDNDRLTSTKMAFLEEGDIYNLSKQLEAIVIKLIDSNDLHFEVVDGPRGPRVYSSETGRNLMWLVVRTRSISRDYETSEVYGINPFSRVFLESSRGYQESYEALKVEYFTVPKFRLVAIGNELVGAIREGSRAQGLGWLRAKMDKGAVQRRRSILTYIEQLFSYRARLLVIRLELGYRKGYFLEREDFFRQDLASVKQDWSFLYSEVKAGLVPDMVGSVAKLEYGILKGFHLHVLLMFDGSKRKSDLRIADIIGRYWQENVTGGHGNFFSCNRAALQREGGKNKYQRLGIGLIGYHDTELRKNLNELVAEYLVKADAVISWVSPNERAFFKGWAPRSSGLMPGRPRTKLSTNDRAAPL
tara:strand:+ start:4911 stop:6017 length:1107 start_codon:yes stop_codon:yes gene_type:complete